MFEPTVSPLLRAGIAQSVYCLTTDWKTGWFGFHPQQWQRSFPLVSVSRPAQEATKPLIQWVLGVLSRGKARLRLDADHWPHLMPRLRLRRNYTPPPKRLHGVKWDSCSFYITLRSVHSVTVATYTDRLENVCDGVRLPSQHCGLGPVVLSPGDSDCELVSRRDRLGLTPNLTTRALWPSPETPLEQ
jgi:hypothetical protein